MEQYGVPVLPNSYMLGSPFRKTPERIMAKKDVIGLVLFERSATKGYHIVFMRRWELSQEDNLKWASEVLGVKYDEEAEDKASMYFYGTYNKEQGQHLALLL